MVKIGFIVEGDSEKILVESASFRNFLSKNGFELLSPVINAKGGGNLLPHNIDVFIKMLLKNNAQKLFVITDLESDASPEIVLGRISDTRIDKVFVAIKALEAWYLADTDAMRKWLSDASFYETNPENTADMPWDRLKEIASNLGKRGPGSKVGFAKKMVNSCGFDLEKSANHDQCDSAKELVVHFKK